MLAVVLGALVATDGGGRQVSARGRVNAQVRLLLAGIPEHGEILGNPRAPAILVFFGDLECLTTRDWVVQYLPAIIRRYVRPGILQIQFRAFRTDTHISSEFIAQQAGALAAGAQDRLWPYIETFYYEQGVEYTPYVTEGFLNGIARQVPALHLTPWHREVAIGRDSKQVVEEDETARALGFHDTPAFQLGPTGGKLKDFAGRRIVEFHYREHPVSEIDTQDIATALKQLTAEGLLKTTDKGRAYDRS